MKIKKVVLLVLVLLLTLSISGCSSPFKSESDKNYETGIKAFNDGEISDAKQYLEKVTSDSKNYNDAQDKLSIASSDENYNSGIESFNAEEWDNAILSFKSVREGTTHYQEASEKLKQAETQKQQSNKALTTFINDSIKEITDLNNPCNELIYSKLRNAVGDDQQSYAIAKSAKVASLQALSGMSQIRSKEVFSLTSAPTSVQTEYEQFTLHCKLKWEAEGRAMDSYIKSLSHTSSSGTSLGEFSKELSSSTNLDSMIAADKVRLENSLK